MKANVGKCKHKHNSTNRGNICSWMNGSGGKGKVEDRNREKVNDPRHNS